MPQSTTMTCIRESSDFSVWLFTLFGLIFYLGDIGSDLLLSVQFFRGGHIAWAALTLVFVLVSSICIQTFSYAWFKDDEKHNDVKGPSTCHLIGVHLLQIGLCTRYLSLLKKRFKALRSGQTKNEEDEISGMAADLSMLRMFETFLESVPQLVLQAYIILEHNHRSNLQYISMAMSFVTIAWSTVDYRRCLRSSLADVKEMPCGIPTAVYLFYKIFTITPRILGLTLFVMLSIYTIPAMALVWTAGFIWAVAVNTDFCSSLVHEYLYRAVVGVILIFTFFNVKGQNTKLPMTIYYIFSVSQNLAAPILLFLLKPESERTDYFLPIVFFILFSNSMGLGLLGLYYCLLHPRDPKYQNASDETDGHKNEAVNGEDDKKADVVDGPKKNVADGVDRNMNNVTDDVDGHMGMKVSDENRFYICMPNEQEKSKIKKPRLKRFMQI